MSRLSAERHRRRVRSWHGARTGRRLDWHAQHDERSRLFGVAEKLQPAPLLSRGWRGPDVADVLDQGAEGACVGAACTQVANSAPRTAEPALTMVDAGQLYRLAQTLDHVPGEAYSGTSVLAGMKAGVALGWWTEYRWCFDVAELAAAVTQLGPAVVGIPWDPAWFEHGTGEPLQLSGQTFAGGHALAVLGYIEASPATNGVAGFGVLNSYGPSWGEGGRAFMPADVMAGLLAQQGEAAVPMGPQLSTPGTPP